MPSVTLFLISTKITLQENHGNLREILENLNTFDGFFKYITAGVTPLISDRPYMNMAYDLPQRIARVA